MQSVGCSLSPRICNQEFSRSLSMDMEQSELFDSRDTEKELRNIVTVKHQPYSYTFLIITMREMYIFDQLEM